MVPRRARRARRAVAFVVVSSTAIALAGCTGLPTRAPIAEEHMPAWAGIEYMSQAVAAHAGFEARLRGEPPAVGFVLGTRAYASLVAEFPNGCTLSIHVEPQGVEGNFGAFACAIEIDRVVATAVVNVYLPSLAELARLRTADAAR